MNSLCEQLTEAYRQEQALYEQVLRLVEEQVGILSAGPAPGAVLASCRRVEQFMAQIAAIEEAVAPAKDRWEKTRDDPDGMLSAVLTAIERTIQAIARAQEHVQRALLECMRVQKERNESARSALNASRAHKLYRAG